jgi:hypothetical protein
MPNEEYVQKSFMEKISGTRYWGRRKPAKAPAVKNLVSARRVP